MCGIAGYISDDKVSGEILKRMTDKLSHRGPDGEGFYSDECCMLGHRRLAIIDQATGDQPIYNESQDLVIIFNGEIYNYREIRAELESAGHSFATMSDTEVIIHGYEEWGRDVTLKLRGMFAFAIWDRSEKELFAARDKWGIKPFYYYHDNGLLVFASEIKAVLEHPEVGKELNENILSAYLCFNSTPTEETFFKGIKRLEPGHRLYFKDGKLTIEEYFFFLPEEADGSTLEESAESIASAMEESVRYHGVADVEVGGFLSGGIDSSYIVSLARQNKTFTVGYDDPAYDEIAYAKDLAKKLGINNYSRQIDKDEYIEAFPRIIYHMDEPLADPAAIALYFVSQTAARHVKVVTSGEGADELFGGYLSYREEVDQSWYMKIPYPVRKAVSAVCGLLPEFPGRNFLYRRGRSLEDEYIGIGRVFSEKEALSLVKNRSQIRTKQITAPFYERTKGLTGLQRRQVIDYYFWLVRDFLHAVDRNTMMFSLEARTPFLDDAVYEAAKALPDAAKVNKATTKPALRLAASGVIPNDAHKKKKLGFPVPLRKWMKEEDLYLKIKEKFRSEAALRFFEGEKIMQLLEDMKSGKKDNYKKVWTIYTFITWYEICFREEQG